MSKDLYATLGVDKTISEKDLKTAYRKLAHENHPDKHPNDPAAEERFKEITNAYGILSDPDKRKKYDTYGSADENAGNSNAAAGMWEEVLRNHMGGFAGGFDDFFNFGQQRQPRGQDLKQGIVISFFEAVKGVNKTVEINYPTTCSSCKGNGAKDASSIKQCGTCGGHGKVARQQGFMQMITTCPSCQGRGHQITAFCSTCAGKGLCDKKEKLNISIPAGVETGNMMKVPNKGAPVAGGITGDLYLEISVLAHPKFKRQGNVIRSEEQVNYFDAILGTIITAETVFGNINLSIPAGAQPEDVLKIAGKGVLNGDHLITLKVKLPKKLSDKQKSLLEELRGLK